MDMFEEARALAGTMKMRKMSQNEIAKMLGVSQSYIANKLRLLQLNSDIQKQIVNHRLSQRHARALLRLNDEATRQLLLDRICEEDLSVARTEALVDLYYCSEAPKIEGKGGTLEKVEMFLNSLNNWLNLMSSSGVYTTKKVSYVGKKMYITICINHD